MTPPRRARGDLAGALTSQVFSSGGNFLLTTMLARRTGALDFGRISIALMVMYFGLELCRALTVETVFGRGHGSGTHLQAGYWGALLSGLCVAALVVPVALVAFDSSARTVALLLGGAFPLVVAFDAARVIGQRTGRAAEVAVLDLLWTGSFVSLLFVVPSTVEWTTAAWLIPAVLVGVAVTLRAGVPRGLADWRGDVRAESRALVADLAIGRGAVELTTVAVGVIAGVGAVGAIRGSELLFAPAIVAVTGLKRGLSASAARADMDERALNTLVLRASIAVTALILVATAGLVTRPGAVIGEALLGATWESAQDLVAITGISAALSACIILGRIPFQLSATTVAYLRSRVLALPFLVVPALVLARFFDGFGAQAGFTFGRAVNLALVGRAAQELRAEEGRRAR